MSDDVAKWALTFGEHLDDRVKREDPNFAAQNKAAWEAAHPTNPPTTQQP